MNIRTVGVLGHPNRPNTAPVANRIRDSFQRRGVEVWSEQQWVDADLSERLSKTSLVVAIGGDGAMLRAARAAAIFGVPVLGVNMGHLGFLTEVDAPDQWDTACEALLKGSYWIERRMMVHVEARHADGGEIHTRSEALNDIVISRGNVTRMIRVPIYIDEHWTTTYHSDALIIATATGSTAYALACGGPILPPELRNILVVPVAPHLSLDRPIVLPDGAEVRALVDADSGVEPILAVDGAKLCDLHHGDEIRVRASDYTAQFVRLRDRNYFYRSLLDRLEPRVDPPKSES
ncbi:MAG: NAD(+)/NADH kinase [Anaerolineae bacterium]